MLNGLSIITSSKLTFQRQTNQCTVRCEQTANILFLKLFLENLTETHATGTGQICVWFACLVHKCANETRLC